MKVLFVCSGNSKYGIVPFIKRQGESLIKEGASVEFYPIKEKGVRGYLRSIKPLSKYIKENQFDVIHAHYGIVGLVCGLTLSRKPLVLSVMGSDAYGRFDSKGKRVLSSYFEMFLTQLALLFADYIIVKSKNILKLIPYKKKTEILPNGVDFDLFRPKGDYLNKNTVLCLADPTDTRKNYVLVEKAVSLMNDESIKLVNPYPIRPDDFPNYLNEASVFVLSSYNEGSPNVIKEAMACNIPIVSTDVGDVKEVIQNTEGCYLTSFESKDVAEKIESAFDFNRRTTGRKDIEHLDSVVIAKRILGIYEKILSK